jgi:type VI secretion system protein ImpE
LTQLGVLADMDASTLAMVQVYGEALRCETFRAEVFAGRRAPLVLGEPEPWLAWLIEALRVSAEGRTEHTRALRDRAFEEAPAIPGTLDGRAFAWLADADPRLGPVLEVILKGQYYWVPTGRVAELRIEPPADLRDLVWLPAQFRWTNGGEAVGLIPTRYAGSEASPDPAIRLARKTVWEDHGAVGVRGLGQRMLATDEGEYPILDVRQVSFTVTEAPEAAPSG